MRIILRFCVRVWAAFSKGSGLYNLLFSMFNCWEILNVGNMQMSPLCLLPLSEAAICPIHYPWITGTFFPPQVISLDTSFHFMFHSMALMQANQLSFTALTLWMFATERWNKMWNGMEIIDYSLATNQAKGLHNIETQHRTSTFQEPIPRTDTDEMKYLIKISIA